MAQSLDWGVCGKAWVRQDRYAGIGELGASWPPLGCRGARGCLVPGPRWFRAEAILTWCVGASSKRCLAVGSGLVGLCTEGTLARESFAIPTN